MNITDFIPPIITKVLKKIQPKNREKILEEFNSYESAQKECVNGDYQNIELCNMIADKTIIFRDSINQSINILNSTNLILLAALNQARISYDLKSLTVLDFGGACGAHYFEIRKYLPVTFKVKWIVVETPQMVLSAKSRNIENEELMFLDNMHKLPKIDFIYSSGALQYTSDPFGFLEDLLKVSANSILFNRMMFNKNDRSIITIQKSSMSDNGPGQMPKKYTDKTITYPHTTLSFLKFNTIVLKEYALGWTVEEGTGSYKIGDEPIFGRGLYFIKK